MATNILQYVTPDQVDEAYEVLIDITKKLQEKYTLERDLKAQIKEREAILSATEDFKWGRNDTEREAQSRDFSPDQWGAYDALKAEMSELQGQKRVAELEIERMNLIKSMFQTVEFDT